MPDATATSYQLVNIPFFHYSPPILCDTPLPPSFTEYFGIGYLMTFSRAVYTHLVLICAGRGPLDHSLAWEPPANASRCTRTGRVARASHPLWKVLFSLLGYSTAIPSPDKPVRSQLLGVFCRKLSSRLPFSIGPRGECCAMRNSSVRGQILMYVQCKMCIL